MFLSAREERKDKEGKVRNTKKHVKNIELQVNGKKECDITQNKDCVEID